MTTNILFIRSFTYNHKNLIKGQIYIIDSDLVQRMQIKIICVCVQEIFSLKCLLNEVVLPNLSHIYFCISEIIKENVSNRFLSMKSLFDFVFSLSEFTTVILQSKSQCEIFALNLSGIQRSLSFFFSRICFLQLNQFCLNFQHG